MASKQSELIARYGKPLDQILQEAYSRHGSQVRVAQELGVSQGTISLWIKILGLREKVTLISAQEVRQ